MLHSLILSMGSTDKVDEEAERKASGMGKQYPKELSTFELWC